jgi:hypothetical protein
MQFVEGIDRVYGPNIDTYEAYIEVTKARLEHNHEGLTLFIMVDWKIKNPYMKKQLAVHMTTPMYLSTCTALVGIVPTCMSFGGLTT